MSARIGDVTFFVGLVWGLIAVTRGSQFGVTCACFVLLIGLADKR